MNLNCETILDVYTYKNRKILCQIKVNSDSGKFKNCRCLSAEQWRVFDKKLEEIIATVDDWNSEKCLKFLINPLIQVKIQKSSSSFRHFNKCLGITTALDGELGEANYILECLFDFKRELLFSPSLDSQESESYTESSLNCTPCSPLSYDPYTPSKEKYETNKMDIVKTSGVDFLKWDESTHSPKSDSGKDTNGALSNEILQKPRLESTNTTPSSSESNGNENISVIDITDKSKNSNESDESDVPTKENAIIFPEKDDNFQIESSKLSKPQASIYCATDELQRDTSSKTEDFSFELKDENVKEKHISKRKKFKTDNSDNHHDNKIRKRSATLDEYTEEVPIETENILPKNRIENVNKESHKKSDKQIEIVSSTEKEKKKVSSTTGRNTAEKEKQNKNLLPENEATSIYKKKTDKTPKTSPIVLNNSSESAIEMSPEKVRRERKLKSCSKDTVVSLRRSERSPSKPKRFVQEITEPLRKSKTKQKSNKINDLFGSDEDEDHLFETKRAKINKNYKRDKLEIFETPVSKKSVECPSTSSSKKKKRKRDKSAECRQEKRDISNWLSKKNSKPLDREAKTTPKSTSKSSKPLPLKSSSNQKPRKVENDSKRRSQSVTPPPMTIELPSKEELELMRNKTNLMREENARIKAELDKMRTSPPKEVEILSLANITEDKILSTFSTYKNELDDIFQNNRKRDYIKGHDGINHCLIIRLLQNSIQMKMLKKLTDVYGCSDSTTQATLFANALLPEWVIRVYMETFSFTRQQAIDQIKAQEAFQLHMEEQNENSFEFD